MIFAYVVGFLLLLAAAVMAMVRIERGPSMFDRILGVDVTTAVLVGAVALVAAATKRSDLVPVLVVLALVGFIASVAIARFAAAESSEEGRILTRDELEQILREREEQTDDAPPVHDVDDEDSGAIITSVDALEESDTEEEGR